MANPDLVERLKNEYPLDAPNPNTFYVNQGEVGYADYPEMN
ncbi:hypothetical protein IGI96_002345 [Enterococcus sp. DIV0421]|nr:MULTISPECIES: hypothetical protein [Enterococcus]OTO01198.1 hypothetical protein A5883_003515 [Enterococcus sp. 5B3_DIV0040]